MKSTLYDSGGNKKDEIQLPEIFSTLVREDLVAKYFEADKFKHPYSPSPTAGRRHSASGTISHQRHNWKGHYGRGISRIPRKTMSRRGTQFFWVGAEISSARGGRRAHPPKGIGVEKKINKKEIELAFSSAFAATANERFIKTRYTSLNHVHPAPVIESLPQKTKSMKQVLEKIFPDNEKLFKIKSVRAGKGKMRGRKYKSNAGILVVVSSNEKQRFSGLDVKSAKEVAISDLYPLGRLTLYTKNALSEIGGRK